MYKSIFGISSGLNLEDIYRMIFNMERIQTDNLTKDVLRRLKASQDLFPDVKDEKEADFLSRFAFTPDPCTNRYLVYLLD